MESSPERQHRLLKGLVGMAGSPANSALFLERLVLFDRDHIIEGEKPWIVFATLVPLVFDALPIATSFIEARLHNAMMEAGSVLSQDDLAHVCDRWVAWIERMDRADHWLDDFALGVTEILFKFLGDRPDLRGDMIERLSKLHLTTSLLTFLKDAVDLWAILSSKERAAVLNALTSDKTDSRWRKAVALTRGEVPAEIQTALLGHGITLSDDTEAVRAAAGDDVFAACLSLQAGSPDMLNEWRSWKTQPLWADLLEQATFDPADPWFKAAFDRALSLSERGDGAIIATVETAAAIDPNAVFQVLLERSIFDVSVR